MATQIINKTPGVVTLPTSLSGHLLQPGGSAVLNLSKADVLVELGGTVPEGVVVRIVPDNQPITPDLPWVP